jgi:uroporphyrinogen-III decarboxylase
MTETLDFTDMEWPVDAKITVARIGHQISLVGNVNTLQMLYQGTVECG